MKIYLMKVTYTYTDEHSWQQMVSVENQGEFVEAVKYAMVDAAARKIVGKEVSRENILALTQNINVELLDTGMEDFPRKPKEEVKVDDAVLV